MEENKKETKVKKKSKKNDIPEYSFTDQTLSIIRPTILINRLKNHDDGPITRDELIEMIEGSIDEVKFVRILPNPEIEKNRIDDGTIRETWRPFMV